MVKKTPYTRLLRHKSQSALWFRLVEQCIVKRLVLNIFKILLTPKGGLTMLQEEIFRDSKQIVSLLRTSWRNARFSAPLLAIVLAGCVATPTPEEVESSSSEASSNPVVSSSPASSSSVATSLGVSSVASASSSSTPAVIQWKACSAEKETCSFEGTSQVRYGANDTWAIENATNAIECTNAAFGGDPLPKVRKSCQVPVSTTLKAPTASSSSPATPPTQDLAKLYQDKGCLACHANGNQITNINVLVDNNTLVKKIADTMPPNNPGSCVGECAQQLAQHMEDLFYQEVSANIRKSNVPIHSAIRKAKMLIEGSAVTEEELKAVQRNPKAIDDLIREWQQEPGYLEKMRWFLEENLQFSREIGPDEYVGQLRGTNKANPPTKFVNPKIYQNGQESAIRTIMDLIVRPDRPFTNIATQTEWMMTPALMSLFLAFDHPNDPDLLDFRIGVDLSDAEKRYSLAKKIETKRFYFPPPAGLDGFKSQNGSIVKLMRNKEIAFIWGALNQYSHQTRNKSHSLFKDSDYTTWKKVKIAKATRNNPRQDFWDLPALRRADTIYVSSERVGFFSHPNFFGRWETNDDNQFRVTINQALITALNLSFAPDDLSITLNEEVLSAEHAAPGTDCYACHRLVDPMRNYFRNLYDDTHGKPRDAASKKAIAEVASFSFGGETETGNDLMDLGRVIASHPAFAPAWVQKLCFYSNSQNCVETDEEFIRVAQAFKDSNYSFNDLIATFFSSELFLKDVEEKSAIAQPAFASISRNQHICQQLSRRMSKFAGNKQNPCNDSKNGASTIADNIPADDWTRGALEPAMPTRPNMFGYTTMENLCRNVALNKYGTPAMPAKPIGSYLDDYLLPHIVGLPKSDPRHGDVRKVLIDHFRDAKSKQGIDSKAAIVSVFTLACSSPLMSSVDF